MRWNMESNTGHLLERSVLWVMQTTRQPPALAILTSYSVHIMWQQQTEKDLGVPLKHSTPPVCITLWRLELFSCHSSAVGYYRLKPDVLQQLLVSLFYLITLQCLENTIALIPALQLLFTVNISHHCMCQVLPLPLCSRGLRADSPNPVRLNRKTV